MQFDEFLNPKSMLTPAIAGSFIMIIANTLWFQFALPQKWSALFLSFLFLVPILKAYVAAFLEKIIYFLFNGLIVFSMAVNTNYAGTFLSELASTSKKPNSVVSQATVSFFPFITNSHADETTQPKGATIKTTVTTIINKKKLKNTTDGSALKKNEPDNSDTTKDSSKERKFFQPWLN